ncbi:hypothetical protein LI171_05075 [Emergencia timonensis]|uniref:hypothetical protein n=1 Tax=Emergencia timonensis TaxID=1776384 RepID=UPI001D0894DE|nr:hypothetical protein [Emergencia timonensis]MCB6475611.1 hypothetical protein [Emergencia timonensis]
MENTKNYNLNKPSPEDFYDIEDFNRNADLLDTELKKHADSLAAKADLVDGKVPEGQLPSYVSAVSEHASKSAFPGVGKANIIYIATDTGICYRWGGTQYVVISDTIALGETAQTAYRGDRGKAAYDHSIKTSGNPHRVTKIDVGLGSVDNTSDANKPVSTAVQTALDKKVDKADGKGLSSNDFTAAYKAKLDNAPEDINSVLTLSEGNKTRYGAGTFDQAFNKAVQILTATVSASGWSSTPTLAGWYENRVNVAGMKAVYNPLLDLVITNATLAEDERSAFGLIMEAETFDGYVIFRALDKPDISFNVRFVGV